MSKANLNKKHDLKIRMDSHKRVHIRNMYVISSDLEMCYQEMTSNVPNKWEKNVAYVTYVRAF